MPERKSPASRTSGSGRRPGSTGARSGRGPGQTPSKGSGQSSGRSSGRSSTNARATSTEPTVDAQPETGTEPEVDAQPETGTAPKVDTTKASGSKPADAAPSGTTASGTKPTDAKTTGAKTTGSKTGSGKPAGRPAASKPTGKPGNRPANRGPAQKRPARKKKSIVNQKQRPWGLIISAIVVVAFAAAVVVVVVATHKSSSSGTATKGGQAVSSGDPYRQAELPAAAAIKGVTYRVEGQHNHVEGKIKYDSTPPVGGNHSQYWADCTGTVYPKAIANENAVHMLEHGAIWITYNKNKLSAAQVSTLAKNVSGIDRMAMSPYPNLKSPISLQAWGYQLFLNSPTDPRIAQFIKALKYNQKTTPEYGATCSQPTFKTTPSTFGNPLWEPKGGASGNVGGL